MVISVTLSRITFARSIQEGGRVESVWLTVVRRDDAMIVIACRAGLLNDWHTLRKKTQRRYADDNNTA